MAFFFQSWHCSLQCKLLITNHFLKGNLRRQTVLFIPCSFLVFLDFERLQSYTSTVLSCGESQSLTNLFSAKTLLTGRVWQKIKYLDCDHTKPLRPPSPSVKTWCFPERLLPRTYVLAMNWSVSTCCNSLNLFGLVPDHRGLEVCSHGDRPSVPVDLHPGVCGGNSGTLHAAIVPKL